MPHPTFCLHKDVFRIATDLLRLMPTTDHSDTERFPTAAT
jgi:hypothetical protein